jgi:hypothetical protein
VPSIIDQLTDGDKIEILEIARAKMTDDDLRIDENAEFGFSPISEGGDNGCWVQSWTWFSFADTKWDQYKDE